MDRKKIARKFFIFSKGILNLEEVLSRAELRTFLLSVLSFINKKIDPERAKQIEKAYQKLLPEQKDEGE